MEKPFKKIKLQYRKDNESKISGKMAEAKLIVIEKAKELGNYLFQITENSPKKFRFTFTSRMQNLALDIVENLYRANSFKLSRENFQEDVNIRKKYQQEAQISLDLLCYIAMMAREHKCILPKHYEQLSLRASEMKRLLYGWTKSDQRRLK